MTNNGTTNHSTALSFRSSVTLVAQREIRMRLRSKAFLISTGILLLAVLASIVISSISAQTESPMRVAVVGGAADVAAELPGLELTQASSQEEAEQLIRDGDVEAAVVPSGGALGITVLALDEAPIALLQMLSVSPEVQLLERGENDPFLVYLVAFGFGFVFFLSAMTFGGTIAQSVVEEKQTRVVEILISAIPVRALLAGKVAGNSLLAFAQVVLIAGVAAVGMLVGGQTIALTALGLPVLWFVVFFAVGFVLLAALFAAAAALVSRQEDVGSVTSPVMMLVMIPYFLIIFFNDNDVVLTVMSYVPFSAPVGMPMRVFLGTAGWWEPLLSLAIVALTAAAVVVLGARVYSNSILRMGSRVKLGEALRG